jgi:hypothetical protein
LISFLVLSLTVAGCSGDSKHGTVSGAVTFDNQPLVKGTISFIPTGGETASADAQIVDGKFSQVVPVGEKRMLPRQYNSGSKLTLTVKPGKQTSDHNLTSGN